MLLLGIRAKVNDYLGSLGVGIHKYCPDTSSSQLGIKSLGTRVPRADGYGSRLLDSLSFGVAVFISERKYVVTLENDGH